MKILKAAHLGMCFGVRDALALAHAEAARGPLTIYGELVHNETVLDGLREAGLEMESHAEKVRTDRVMITAHGTSDRTRGRLNALGLKVLEATCPLVRVAHEAVRSLAAAGYHPVIVGKRDHVEVRGLTGDLASFDVVIDEEDVDRLEERARFGVAAQTTQPVARVRALVARLRARFPRAEVRFIDTVCQRQAAAETLARECEVVIVVGGAHSNNTRELAATCARHCPRVHMVQTAADLRREWLLDASVVGLTAGTSTPDSTIDAVERRLLELADSAWVETAA